MIQFVSQTHELEKVAGIEISKMNWNMKMEVALPSYSYQNKSVLHTGVNH